MGYRRVKAGSSKAARRKCTSKYTSVGRVNKIKGTKNSYGVFTHRKKHK